jgi:formamidopyrimidine-DNA glycosylase
MPELPEVEVVRAGLAPAVTGATVTGVTVFDERSLKRHPGTSDDFAERLTGAVFEEPRRRGKFLWIPLAPLKTQEFRPISRSNSVSGDPTSKTPAFSDGALVVHLGMSGQVLLREPGAALDRLTRIQLDIEHPVHGELRVDFVDQRIFGSMALDRLVPTDDLAGDTVPTQVAHIARDPMDENFDDALFFDRLAKRNTGIKRALLDQSLISGIGNIYADEALWAARIHYDQPTGTLSRAKAKTLLAEVRLVLGKALAEGGTSFDAQYLNVNGESGYFSHSLNAYGQQGEPCPRCGRPIVRQQFMNRGSHFCAFCQRVRNS